METIKLTQEELDNLNNLKLTQDNLVVKLGELSYQIESLELQKDQAIEELQTLIKQQNNIGASLKEKYGDGTINLTDGTFSKIQ